MGAKKKIIVSVINDLVTDQRVRKVCEFLVKNGYDVTLLGRKLKSSLPMSDTAYRTVRFRLPFTKGAMFYATYNLRLFFYLIFHKCDVLLSNDLDTLLANHWARKFKRNCRLIYDSHEYFTGVPELADNPKVKRFWERIEKKTVPGVDTMYTVNDSIAGLYRKQYNREVFVVRNIAERRPVEQLKTKDELGLPDNKKIIIIQGAGINIDRGAEEMVEAMKFIPDVWLIFVGDGDAVSSLKEQVKRLNLDEQVKFFGKRPYNELMNFTIHADLGVSMDKDTNINYRFSLPNKLFDYIHAGIPVLVSDLPEIRRIVDEYDLGIISTTHEPQGIAELVNGLFADEERYYQLTENARTAARELTWEKETQMLKQIFLQDGE